MSFRNGVWANASYLGKRYMLAPLRESRLSHSRHVEVGGSKGQSVSLSAVVVADAKPSFLPLLFLFRAVVAARNCDNSLHMCFPRSSWRHRDRHKSPSFRGSQSLYTDDIARRRCRRDVVLWGGWWSTGGICASIQGFRTKVYDFAARRQEDVLRTT